MSVKDLYSGRNRTVLSFEVFPPKRSSSPDSIYRTLEGLVALNPDFVSVTYGAGGSGNNGQTLEIAKYIRDELHIESVAHLPCAAMSLEQIRSQLDAFAKMGLENVLALRGDDSGGGQGAFAHANELVAFIREHYSFNVLAACYPETHPEAANETEDILHLRDKVNAGVSSLITQLFFDNKAFYRFRERCRLAGISVPIEAGIMPVANLRQIERMVAICGARLPRKFVTMMNRFSDRPEAMVEAGIAYAVNQIVDLISHGVDGIHLYTMNNLYIARRIHEAVYRLL